MGRVFKWALAGTVAFAMTSAVCAQEQPECGAAELKKDVKTAAKIVKSVFHKTDADKDGKLTVAEQQSQVKEWLKELDANQDGKLSADEFVGQRFVNIDIDKDGVVTMEEYLVFFAGPDAAAGQTAACNKLDANNDGEVTALEVVAYRKSVFAAIDSDSDSKVAPDEMKTADGKKFKGLDVDGDGFVTVEEFIAIIPVTVVAEPTVTESEPGIAPEPEAPMAGGAVE